MAMSSSRHGEEESRAYKQLSLAVISVIGDPEWCAGEEHILPGKEGMVH